MNAFGNIFTSDNDDDGNRGCRVIWAMDGGHYGYRTPGSPRHWGEEVPGNVPKLVGTGNGSPCGIMVYEGELLPAEYRGAVLEVDAGTRQVNFFPITRKGAAFRTQYKVFLSRTTPGSGRLTRAQALMGRSSSPTGTTLESAATPSAIRRPGGFIGSRRKGTRVRSRSLTSRPSAGLITALKSPNIATQDAARRGLIAHGKDGNAGGRGRDRGRARHKNRSTGGVPSGSGTRSTGDSVALAALADAVNQAEPATS